MTQQPAPESTQTAPPPASKSGNKKLVIIIIAAVLVPFLALGGIVFFAWWDNYSRFEVVQEKPNAASLTPFPLTDSFPTAIDRYAVQVADDTISFVSYDQSERISFGLKDAEYWDQRIRGAGWSEKGDLVCEDNDITTPGAFCAVAFTNATLVVQTSDGLLSETQRLTEAYLAALRGDSFDHDWAGVAPPNLSWLPTIAGLQPAFPEYLEDPQWGEPLAEAEGPDATRHWSLWYSSNDFTGVSYTAYKDARLWAYYATVPGVQPLGDALCLLDEEFVDFCIYAGSDGIIVANTIGAVVFTEDLVDPLFTALD